MTDLLPEQLPPEQNSSIQATSSVGDDDMYAKITCSPPLGQATIISGHQQSVQFTILLETSSQSSSQGNDKAQVCIWHNHNGEHEWTELQLNADEEVGEVASFNRSKGEGLTRSWYTAELSGLPKHAHMV